MTVATTESTMTDHEAAQIDRANATNATPVVFVHGLWLLPSSWDRWVTLFEEAGYVAVTPGWPDDPDTVAEARQHPEVFAGKGITEIADYEDRIIRRLDRKPVIIGHSFGGLLTMILAGRGLAAASIAISPAPFRGVLPLPFSALRTASVALRNPANWNVRGTRCVGHRSQFARRTGGFELTNRELPRVSDGHFRPGAGGPCVCASAEVRSIDHDCKRRRGTDLPAEPAVRATGRRGDGRRSDGDHRDRSSISQTSARKSRAVRRRRRVLQRDLHGRSAARRLRRNHRGGWRQLGGSGGPVPRPDW
jgi:pimeloyl-ACP methyl ester carboxylesterase